MSRDQKIGVALLIPVYLALISAITYDITRHKDWDDPPDFRGRISKDPEAPQNKPGFISSSSR